MTKILYLILNFKTYSDTIRVTKELLQTDRTDFKILIVDNASPNESYNEISKFFAGNELVEVILSPENGGYAKGNNFGLRYAKKYNPEYVCIMNNDVHFSWDTIDAMCEIYESLEKPALISPIQVNPDGSKLSFAEFKVPDLIYDIRMNTLFFQPKRHLYVSNTNFANVQKVGYLPGALLFTKYTVFEMLGFFDESTFLFCEERFIGKTVADAGLNNYIITDLTYLHEHSKTIKNEVYEKRQKRWIHEGRLKYHARYSKCPFVAKALLNLAFYLHEFELSFISFLRKK